MDVVSAKTDEVYEKEHDGETQIHIALVHEVEAEAEEDGNGYPTKIEEACPEVQERPIVFSKIFVGCQGTRRSSDAEERFFCLVQILHVNRVYLVIGYNVHPVVGHSKEDEGQ